MLPKQYQGRPENLLYAISYAESLGIHPMTAITGIHVIEGKPSASAQLIGSLVRRAGHKLRVTGDDHKATAVIIRADDPDFEFRVEWTFERAKAAGLTGKSVWKNYPAAMLKARAITEVAREGCAEALFGVIYTPEELGADGNIGEDGSFTSITVTASPLTPPRDWVREAEATDDVDALRKLHREAVEAFAPADTLDAIVSRGRSLAEAAQAATVEADDIVDAEVVEDHPLAQALADAFPAPAPEEVK